LPIRHSLATLDGHVDEVGDTSPLTIQSMSKPFGFALALDNARRSKVKAQSASNVRGEPSNSIRLNAEKPRSPRGNARRHRLAGLIHEPGAGTYEYTSGAGRFRRRESAR